MGAKLPIWKGRSIRYVLVGEVINGRRPFTSLMEQEVRIFIEREILRDLPRLREVHDLLYAPLSTN